MSSVSSVLTFVISRWVAWPFSPIKRLGTNGVLMLTEDCLSSSTLCSKARKLSRRWMIVVGAILSKSKSPVYSRVSTAKDGHLLSFHIAGCLKHGSGRYQSLRLPPMSRARGKGTTAHGTMTALDPVHPARSSDGEEVTFFWISSYSFIEKDRCIKPFDLLDQAVAQFFTSQIGKARYIEDTLFWIENSWLPLPVGVRNQSVWLYLAHIAKKQQMTNWSASNNCNIINFWHSYLLQGFLCFHCIAKWEEWEKVGKEMIWRLGGAGKVSKKILTASLKSVIKLLRF